MIGLPAAVFFVAVQHAQASLTLTWTTAPLFISVLNMGTPRRARTSGR